MKDNITVKAREEKNVILKYLIISYHFWIIIRMVIRMMIWHVV